MTQFRLASPDRPIIKVDALVNVKGPFGFVVDTGASITVIDKQTMEKLGLSDGRATSREDMGAGGEVPIASLITLESIKVGDTEVRDVQAAVMDLSDVSRCCGLNDFGGIIGYSFMKEYKVIIDYRRQEIFFQKS